VEAARKQGWNPEAEKAGFGKLTSGIGEPIGDAGAIARADVEASTAALDHAVRLSMLDALFKLGLFVRDEALSLDDIMQRGGIAPELRWLVSRWLAMLTKSGLLQEHPGDRFSCPHQPDWSLLSGYWEQADAAWTNVLSSAGFIQYVRSNAERLPELLCGQQDPVALLFPEGRLDLVRSLYVDHAMANYLNQCICTLLKHIAEDNAPAGKPLRILEVGAGTGATTEKVLSTLAGFNVDYVFTDVSSFFLPGAKASFGHFPGIRFGLFDVDRDYREQGLAPNSFDVILAAGVLENARDIPSSMNRLTELISPGGWLVFTEPTAEHAWILASQAFMMAEPGDALRTETSYLSQDAWLKLLREYGNGPILCLPDKQHPLAAMGFHLFAQRIKQDRQEVRVPELMEYLSLRLPAHMLPSHLQVADAMPLTGNGKVDRRVVASWRPKLIESFAAESEEASSDPLEAQLAQLWAEALGIPSIGRSQSFYDLGADSLILAQVAGKLRDKLAGDTQQADIPFDALLRHMLNYPTVATLAEFIHYRNQEQERVARESGSTSPTAVRSSNAVLTPYGGGESGPLRVVFHAGLGTMNCFRLLLERLKAQQLGPVIGITVADVEEYCALEPSLLIEHIADDYAGRLLETGHRRMQLIGYCLGGIIAIEVARRLVEKGIHLVDLVLIDSHPVLVDIDDDLVLEALFVPNLNISFQQAGFSDVSAGDLTRGLLRILETNNQRMPQGSMLTLGGDEGLDKAGELFRMLAALPMRERFSAYVEAMARTTGEQMPVEMAEGLFKIYRQSFKAARFTPPPYMGDIRFLLAVEPSGFLPGAEQMAMEFWQDVCLGHFEVAEIAGNHFSCIENELNAVDLAIRMAEPLVKA
jgi:pyochelin synthetase